MTTLDEALETIGTEAQFTSHGLHIQVRIVGVKTAWGRESDRDQAWGTR